MDRIFEFSMVKNIRWMDFGLFVLGKQHMHFCFFQLSVLMYGTAERQWKQKQKGRVDAGIRVS